MCIVKYLVSVFIVVVVVRANGAEETSVKKDHNKDEHSVLCDLLNAAVFKWKEIKNSDSPLKKALAKTIFGNESGGNLEHLMSPPADYDELKSRTLPRYYWCGERNQGGGSSGSNPPRRSGHSAPHDLICLCTPGDGSWPVSGTVDGKQTLCGKEGTELGVDSSKEGWGLEKKGISQIKATWNSVVAECLHGSGKVTELKDSLEKFIDTLGKMVHETQEHKVLGDGGSGDYPCCGSKAYGVCVKYYTEDKHTLPWWKDLKQAIEAYELEKKKKEESEKSKKEEQKQREPQNKYKSKLPHAPRTAALRSAAQDPQEAEQDNTENISSPLATLEETSGTFIAPSCSWLLSALLFI